MHRNIIHIFLSGLILIPGFDSLSQPIIVDHTCVEKYQDIPANYISEVKKMWITIPGESHSVAYRTGCSMLEQINPAFDVNVVDGGTPEAYTDQHLRISRATWGDVDHASGWIYFYGEEDWFTSVAAISRTKAGITYCNTHSLNISAIGFAWCWDPGISFPDYISATDEYVSYCRSMGYTTKVFFTTGTVDNSSGESGYIKHLGYESIRDHVENSADLVLFDYADILCYNDNGTTNTTTWNGHTYPVITSANLGDGSLGHISSTGALRLGKAVWYMLARMAGWNGLPEGYDTEAPTAPANLQGTALSSTSVHLSWTASTDNVGVTGYRIYRNGAFINTATGTSFTDNGVSAGNTYFYYVTAVDATVNESSPSSTVVITINIPVGSISVTGQGGSSAISADDGTLQLYAGVLPGNATNKTVTWSLENGTGRALISPSGQVTALMNGIVTAKATANDGSGVYGTLIITVSGQVMPVITANAGSGGTIVPAGSITVEQGSVQSFVITAAVGFALSQVTVDGVPVGAVTEWQFDNVTDDHSISASFMSLNNIALNKPATAQTSTTVFVPSNANDEDGTNSSYWQAIPYAKWWKVDLEGFYDISWIVIRNFVASNRYYQYTIEASSDDLTYTRIAEKQNTVITADAGDPYKVNITARYIRVNMTFNSANTGVHITDFRVYGVPNTGLQTIYSSAGTGGSITPSGPVILATGYSQSFSIKADAGYRISDVLVDGASVGPVTGWQFTNVTSWHTINATFVPLPNVALNKPATAQSSTTRFVPSNANDTDGTNNSYWQGVPYSQWWKVDMEGVYDISAVVIRNYVAANRYYHYNIEASTDDQTYVKIAEKNNNNITTDAGDAYLMNATARYIKVNMTFNSANTGVHITDFRAYGTPNPGFHTIYSSSGAGGTIAPSGVAVLGTGSSQNYTITASAGYRISDVLVDNISAGAAADYHFRNLTSGHTITALFEPMPNIALNKPASAQSSTTIFVPSRANDEDGANDSYWQAIPYSQWWKVDLEDVYDISSVVIRNFVASNRYYNYNIEASTDDLNYFQVAEKNNSDITTDAGDVYTINAAARYLRVNMTYNSANTGVHITDFRAYGTLSGSNKSLSEVSSGEEIPGIRFQASVFPNPFKDEFALRIDSPDEEQFDVSVYDLNGRKLYLFTGIPSNTENRFNLDLEQGIYLLNLNNPGRKIIIRIIKN